MLYVKNKLCDTCKVNRVYDVCDRKHGICDEVIGCPHYIPTELYYRGGEPWGKCLGYGEYYSVVGINNKDIVTAVKECDMENELKKCATNLGMLSQEIYEDLYDIIKGRLCSNDNNLVFERNHPEEYEKCLAENINICIGKFFSYIQRMEDSGHISWNDFIKELKWNDTILHGRDITITYQEKNTCIIQNLIFDNNGNFTNNKKEIVFKHGWTRYAAGEPDRTECIVKVFRNQVLEIEKSKADWITSKRRYTLIFRNKKKMFFDMF